MAGVVNERVAVVASSIFFIIHSSFVPSYPVTCVRPTFFLLRGNFCDLDVWDEVVHLQEEIFVNICVRGI